MDELEMFEAKRLAALLEKARYLRDKVKQLSAKSEDLRKQIEESTHKRMGRNSK